MSQAGLSHATAPSGRSSPRARWGIVLLAQEPAALVLIHLAWHRAAGAAELHLYLDDPADPAAKAAAAIPGVRVTRCDAGFWAAHPAKRRPGLITARQSYCASHAYRRAGVDWLLHVDADEFLFQTAPLTDELSGLEAGADVLVVPVRERVYTRPNPETLFEGLFRRPLKGPDRACPLLQPIRDFAPQGMVGHSLGKSFSRTGLGYQIRPHFPRSAAGEELPSRPCTSSVLLHFDGLTPAHWIAKQTARLPGPGAPAPARYLGPHRQAQLSALADCAGDPVRIRALHDRLRVLEDPARWLAAGLVVAHDFAPQPPARAMLDPILAQMPDFSVTGFDAALAARS